MNTKTFIVTLLLPLLVFARDTEALFLKKLHTFITKQESVEYAHKQIQDLKSPFRIDAVEFLREIKDVHSIPFLQKFMRDKDLNTFVIYALGELQAYEVTQDLIDLLDYPYPNVRGNAFAALSKIYPMDLPQGYVYEQNKIRQRDEIAKIRKWWSLRGEMLTKDYKRTIFENEKEKEDMWEKYGKQYLYQN